MRGRKLSDLVRMLKGELGYSLETGVALQADARCKVVLSNMQISLSSHYDWSFLGRQWDFSIADGQNLVAVPINAGDETLNTERPYQLFVQFGQYWQEVLFGIDSREYNTLFTPQDPIQRFNYAADGIAGDVFEVWPTTVSTQYLRLFGQRNVRPLTDDNHVADLDDLLLVFFSAAELAAEADNKAASLKLAKAQDRLRTVLQTNLQRDEPLILGANTMPGSRKRMFAIAGGGGSGGIGGGGTGGSTGQVVLYAYTGDYPTTIPTDVSKPSIAYKLGGGPMFTWNTTTHVWE